MKNRIYLAQNNYIVGDVWGNAQKIIKSLQKAQKMGCDLFVTSELALIGYPPKDLLYYATLQKKAQDALEQILPYTQGISALIGTIRCVDDKPQRLYNSCAILQNAEKKSFYDKRLLPTYDVFDEKRYFEIGLSSPVFEHKGQTIALSICEDMWAGASLGQYAQNPIDDLQASRPDLMINLSASPFEVNKLKRRTHLGMKVAQKVGCPLIFCNQVGANDSLVFDGHSFACTSEKLLALAKGFQEDELVLNFNNASAFSLPHFSEAEQLYDALILGIRDYFHKQNFKQAIIGLSGGIDSALVTTLCCHAIGKENVTALSMPSRFSSEHSVSDAQALANNLNIELLKIPIEQIHQSYLDLLKNPFKNLPEDVTEENIQSRIRGMILMAFSNKLQHLVMSCGNKSEMAMGYATLYGDLTGGLAAISDLTKTQVYEVARWINQEHKVIPENILNKEPSAELRANQKDSDSLPDYALLDQIIVEYVEHYNEAEEIAEKLNVELELVRGIIRKIHLSEYKRLQAPLGLKVSSKAFSTGRHFPIVHEHKPAQAL